MWNIIKAQNYQIKRDNVTVYVFLFGLIISLIMPIVDGDSDISDLTGSDFVLALSGSVEVILPIAVLVLTTRICGWDYGDKTMNYEILAGHSRKQVYLGRVVSSIVVTLACCIVMTAVPTILYTIIGGWGASLDFGNVMLSFILAFFPLLRLISFFALLTFLLKKGYIALIVGWMLFGIQVIGATLVFEFFDVKGSVQFASVNLRSLFSYNNAVFKTVNGKDVAVFASSLSGSLILQTIVVSIVVSVIYLLLGYRIFKHRDLS
jgi:ABC-type transport system involved in multi-copper enzyme maturation permease subunit